MEDMEKKYCPFLRRFCDNNCALLMDDREGGNQCAFAMIAESAWRTAFQMDEVDSMLHVELRNMANTM